MTKLLSDDPNGTKVTVSLQKLEQSLARRSLIDFACYVDPMVAAQYQAPHLARIAAKLEAVERGEIKRLFITCPPRHWKSSLVSEKFPAWCLGREPESAFILASHSLNLAEKFSRTVRDTILWNDKFQALFPKCRLKGDAGGVFDWALTGALRSSFRAVGVGGGITGMGAKRIVIDDPVADAMAAMSKTQRDNLYDWYQQTLRTRLEPNGSITLIMSRWHMDDLAGRILKASQEGDGEQWESLHMPAIDAEGNALWPDRWPIPALEEIRKGQKGSQAFAALYMGTPRAMEGAILDSTKLVMVNQEDLPKRLYGHVRRWDLAFSDRDGADYVAGAKLARDDAGNIYILHIKRVHGRWTQSKPTIMAQANQDGIDCLQLIEVNGTQLGYHDDIKASPQMAESTVLPDKAEGTKEMRASAWGSRLVDGIIHCVRGEWNQAFFDEMDFFPNGEHDDQIDAVSGAYLWLAKNGPSAYQRVVLPGLERGRPFANRRGGLVF